MITYKIHHSDFIKKLCESIGPGSYLELGLYDGDTFSKVFNVCPRCIGVDIQDIRKIKCGEFYQTTTDLFFEKFTDKVDVIFIDADHRFEQVKKDFHNALNILNKYGIIILHDTDPIDPSLFDDTRCSDSYKIVDYIQSLNDYDIITFPFTEAGLSIIKRKSDRRVLEYL